MTTLAIHFKNGEHTIVERVTAYFLYGNYWHVRTFLGNCPETQHYARKNVIAVFEVLNDEQRRII